MKKLMIEHMLPKVFTMNRCFQKIGIFMLASGCMNVVESMSSKTILMREKAILMREMVTGGAAAGVPSDFLPGQVNEPRATEIAAAAPDAAADSSAVVQLVLEEDIEDNSDLFDAAWQADLEKVRDLLERGVAINGKGYQGRTALHAAAYKGYFEIIDLLLNTPGVDVNARADNGETPLNCAVRGYGPGIVERLLQVPAIDVNAQDAFGFTALHLAARLQGTEQDMAALLNDDRINLELRLINPHGVDDGATPLHVAAEWSNINALRALLEKGADVNATNARGQTALQLVPDNGDEGEACVKLLESYLSLPIMLPSGGCMSCGAFSWFFKKS